MSPSTVSVLHHTAHRRLRLSCRQSGPRMGGRVTALRKTLRLRRGCLHCRLLASTVKCPANATACYVLSPCVTLGAVYQRPGCQTGPFSHGFNSGSYRTPDRLIASGKDFDLAPRPACVVSQSTGADRPLSCRSKAASSHCVDEEEPRLQPGSREP